jgi:hypothetical protein
VWSPDIHIASCANWLLELLVLVLVLLLLLLLVLLLLLLLQCSPLGALT